MQSYRAPFCVLDISVEREMHKTFNLYHSNCWEFLGSQGLENSSTVAMSQLTRKDPDAGKDWRQKEKGMTEDEMVGRPHRLNGHEFEQNSRRWWRTGKPDVLQSLRSQRVRHNVATEQPPLSVHWTDTRYGWNSAKTSQRHPGSEFTAARLHLGWGKDKTQGPQGCLSFPDPEKARETFHKKKKRKEKHPILLAREATTVQRDFKKGGGGILLSHTEPVPSRKSKRSGIFYEECWFLSFPNSRAHGALVVVVQSLSRVQLFTLVYP